MLKNSPRIITALILGLAVFSGFASAQTPAAAQTVTGCLQKGVEPRGGFYLITANDKHLELYDDGKASLGDHVGQTVTVSGGSAKRSAEDEKSSQPYEKQETGTRKHADFQVASLTVVSQTCK